MIILQAAFQFRFWAQHEFNRCQQYRRDIATVSLKSPFEALKKYDLKTTTYPQLLLWIISSGKSKVDYFNAVSFARQEQNVLWFQIQMYDATLVHKLHGLA